MLERLTINNLVLIEKDSLELSKGLISLTGETGAGKSVLIDSIALVLGQRSNSGVVREGADSAVIQADFVFDEKHNSLKKLKDFGIDIEDNEFSIRRKITADGRSAIFINGNKVSQSQVKQISASLVDMHSQYDNQILLDNKNHIELLDTFAEIDKSKLQGLFADYKSKEKELNEFKEKAKNHERELELQRSYLEELELLDVKENEVESLTEERNMLMNAEKVGGSIQQADRILNSDIVSKIQQAEQYLTSASLDMPLKFKEKMDLSISRLASLGFEIEDVAGEVGYLFQLMDMSPERLEEVDERLFTIKDCARKHDVYHSELIELKETIRLEVEKLENYEQNMGDLEAEIGVLKEKLISEAEKVHKQREEFSEKLEQEIETVLKSLHMKNAQFKVKFKELDFENWTVNGSHFTEFFVSTNLGQAFSGLAKVASGGEVARLMLALKVVFFKNIPSQTLVFDEIDTGVGGQVADAVGECIKELSAHHQVIVISHQAQVASKANQHLKVEKSVIDNKTVSKILQLEGEDVLNEMARMISGKEITSEGIELARTMLN
ncbi:MAG: DNA repair protein RecN [Proteobacteria bacterium]|nr:DNA repair protein RecN [Pseudomonadota bacterium]